MGNRSLVRIAANELRCQKHNDNIVDRSRQCIYGRKHINDHKQKNKETNRLIVHNKTSIQIHKTTYFLFTFSLISKRNMFCFGYCDLIAFRIRHKYNIISAYKSTAIYVLVSVHKKADTLIGVSLFCFKSP